MSLYKITVLGQGGVGKTAVTIRLCSNHFVEYYGLILPLVDYLSIFV